MPLSGIMMRLLATSLASGSRPGRRAEPSRGANSAEPWQRIWAPRCQWLGRLGPGGLLIIVSVCQSRWVASELGLTPAGEPPQPRRECMCTLENTVTPAATMIRHGVFSWDGRGADSETRVPALAVGEEQPQGPGHPLRSRWDAAAGRAGETGLRDCLKDREPRRTGSGPLA